jgi:hypothetical protein
MRIGQHTGEHLLVGCRDKGYGNITTGQQAAAAERLTTLIIQY